MKTKFKMINFYDPINKEQYKNVVNDFVKQGYKKSDAPICTVLQNEYNVIIVYKVNA